MLTLEETRWSLKAFKIFSILNILPLEVDVESGKIQRQSNKIRVFIWKFLFGVGVLDWLYVFGRLIQSTILEPQKYFRWDHFVLHFGMTFAYAVFYYTGFWLFAKTPDENVMIFNQLFKEREDPAQKIIDQSTQPKMNRKSRNGMGKRAFAPRRKIPAKLGAKIASTPFSELSSHEKIQKDVVENPFESEVGPRPLLRWPPQYSLDELLAKLHPILMMFTAFFSLLIFAVDPTRPQLLYSALPPEYQNAWTFLLVFAFEALCLSILAFTAGFTVVTQVLFFGKCQLEFQRMSLQLRHVQEKFQNRSLGNGIGIGGGEIWILRQILKEMRELVLFIELFNRCFPFCIFAWKVFSLSVCIMFYFFAIRHHEDFPVLVCFVGYLAFALTLTYTIMYGHAFSIPEKMDELKQEFLLSAQKTASKSNESKIFWAEMKRETKGIRNVGIKVGSFNQMERESTLRFIDFVLRNVVTLLVTFAQ